MLENASPGSPTTAHSSLSVDTHSDQCEIVLVMSGEADAANAPQLAHALNEASANGHTHIAVDLTDLAFIDTRCLGIIFGALDRLRERGVDLVLRAPQPSVRRLLDILHRQDTIEAA